MPQRTCRVCHEAKFLHEFGKSSWHKDGKMTTCLGCCRKRGAAYRETHREELRIQSAEYFASHREQHRQTVHAYDVSHREERRAYWHANKEETNRIRRLAYTIDPTKRRQSSRAWWARNAEVIKHRRRERAEILRQAWKRYRETHQEKLHAYYEAHREQTNTRARAWAKANPKREAANEQRRRARKQALPDTWTAAQVAFMLEYWQQSCAVCGNSEGLLWSLAHDHWIPLASSDCPGTVATNMIPLCHGTMSCNNSKNASDPHTWLMTRFGAKKAARIERAIVLYFTEVKHMFP